jgi:MFS family permease
MEEIMQPADSLRAQIGTLIVATSIVQLASGFFGTFVSMRVAAEHFDAAGLVLAAYFAGATLGALRSDRIIERIGYIRAYAAFAGLVAAATSLMPLLVGPLSWLILRTIIGFGSAGVYVATESWLNAKALPEERGRVFSIYMVAMFLALALGQLLIGRVDMASSRPFNAITALFAVALVLVSAARAEPPKVSAAVSGLRYGELAKAAPVASAGCAINGVITGAFYSLVPAWMQDHSVKQTSIALIMLMVVLGGFALQVPVGRLSDRFDRRLVLSAICIAFAGTAFVMIGLPRTLTAMLPAAALLGGFMSALYPVAVSHAHDRMPADRVVAVSARLILLSGVGAVLGPIVGTSIMAHFQIDGVFYFMAAAALVLAVAAVADSAMTPSPKRLKPTFDILAPQAGPLAHDPMDSSIP